eukprot:6916254-Prymnesium_polylepis.1
MAHRFFERLDTPSTEPRQRGAEHAAALLPLWEHLELDAAKVAYERAPRPVALHCRPVLHEAREDGRLRGHLAGTALAHASALREPRGSVDSLELALRVSGGRRERARLACGVWSQRAHGSGVGVGISKGRTKVRQVFGEVKV